MKAGMIKSEIALYGRKTVASGLSAGAGGNISARAGGIIYLSPSGMSLDEITPENCAGVEVSSGRQLSGSARPTSETALHLACYRKRPRAGGILHTHSPWAGGVISSGIKIRPMFPEFVCDIESIAYLDYICPTTAELAEAAGELAAGNDVILMANHGILACGETLREAFFKCMVIEDAAKSLVAASVCGKPKFLTEKQISRIKELEAVKYRQKMLKER